MARNEELISEFAPSQGCREVPDVLHLERTSINLDEGEIPKVDQVGKSLAPYDFYLRTFKITIMVPVIITGYHTAEEFVKNPFCSDSCQSFFIKNNPHRITNKNVGMGETVCLREAHDEEN